LDEAQAAHALGEAIAHFVRAFMPKPQATPVPEPSLQQLRQLLEQRPRPMTAQPAPSPPPAAAKPEEQLLSTRMAARLLNISERTLWTMSHPRGAIQTVRVGRRVLYPRTELMNWIAENTSR
jgi:excisionase family DNA binding protein